MGRYLGFAAGVLATLSWPLAAQDDAPAAAAETRPTLIPTAHFAGRSQLSNAQLSPDGNQFALETEINGETYIFLYDADTRATTRQFAIGKMELEWFRWAGNDKILISLAQPGSFYGSDVRYTRLVLVHLHDRWVEMLGRRNPVVDGDDVIHIARDGSYALVSVQRDIYSYPSVYRYELARDGNISEVQRPREGVWNWYADDAGVVRIGSGWVNRRLRIFYRSSADGDLKLVGRLKEDDGDDKFWDVAQIVSGSDRGYVMQANADGRVGLHLFDYARREIVETVYENADWDVEDALIRDGKPIGAFYTDDRERAVWFDNESKRDHALLEQALTEDEVWITSRAHDDSRMLVYAGGEADPGAIYVYTPGQKRLDQFADLRPKLDFRNLAKPRPVSFTARDGTKIPAYLTLPRGRGEKNLPLIVLPHGGPFWVRDKLQYRDEVQLLANRGYAVLQPNFRGSGGYGEAFHQLGAGQIGRKMQDDLDDAMDWAVEQGFADASRVCMVGGSYGGYAALWAVIRNPERYRCAASWAGVTDWDRMLKYDRRFLSRKGRQQWEGLIAGEGTDLDAVSPYRLAPSLTRPVLLAHGTSDSNVPFSQFNRFRDAAKGAPVQPVTLVIKDEGHSLSKPENEQAWYDALVAFLAEHNPAD